MSSLDHPRPMRGLLASEVAIKRTELEPLRRKEAAHDNYLRSLDILATGSETMREEAKKGSQFAEGWLGCLRLLHQTIADGNMEPPPEHESGPW
jgi:hypothetical protein